MMLENAVPTGELERMTAMEASKAARRSRLVYLINRYGQTL
jgi:hypothetical protein